MILKQTFKSLIKTSTTKPYSLYFHDSKFDFCNQVVDYFGWAIYRKWEVAYIIPEWPDKKDAPDSRKIRKQRSQADPVSC